RAAAHGKIVADHNDRTSINLAATEHAVGGSGAFQLALLVIFSNTGYGADFVEAFLVEQAVDALAHREPPLVVLPLDLVRAAHCARQGLPPGQFVKLRLPVHSFLRGDFSGKLPKAAQLASADRGRCCRRSPTWHRWPRSAPEAWGQHRGAAASRHKRRTKVRS